MQAYVLITVNAGKVIESLGEIKKIDGVKSAHATIGPYDIIAFVGFDSPDVLTSLIVDKIQKVAWVSRTLTSIASD